MDRSDYMPIHNREVTADDLEGANVYGPGDEKIGTVSEIHGAGPGLRTVVDVGGFLGIGSKPVAIDRARLNFLEDKSGTVIATTAMTKDQMKELPEYRAA